MKINSIKDKSEIKILFISNFFPPAGMQEGIRILNLSKRLVNENIHPIILTRKYNKKNVFNISAMKEIPENLEIYRVPFLDIKNILRSIEVYFNFDYYLEWIPHAYFYGKRIVKKHKDIKYIYSTGPKFCCHILNYLISKKYNITSILEYRDPWSFNPYNMKKYLLNKKINIYLERKILKNASAIITISPALKDFLISKFPFVKKKLVISVPNGLNIYKIEDFKRSGEEIILLFTGVLYGKRNIFPLLKILSELKKEKFLEKIKIKLKIFGRYGNLLEVIEKFDIKDLIFLGGFVERSKALEEIEKCDIPIHVGGNLDYPTIAFKVWDYLSYRKKILYIGREDSYTAKFLNKNHFGITVPIDNLVKAKNIVKKLLSDLINKRINFQIDKDKLNKFTWDLRAKDIIEKILKPNHNL